MRRTGKVTASRGWVLTCVVALGVVLVPSFDGTARADVLVLDACMGKCNEGDWLAISNMRRVLESDLHNGAVVASVDRMIYRLGANVPFPGVDDPRLTVEQLTKHLKDGIDRWTGGDYEYAAKTLKVALGEAAMNPAIVAADSTLRPLVQRAYVAQAMSLFRLEHRDEAKEAIADLVRMTPQPSILDTWGTAPDRVFQLSRNDLMARGTGALSIEVNDPTAVFYLNAAGQPHRAAFTGDMLPGIYQVLVTDTVKRSRRYRVEVVPHEHAVLNIDWRRDTSLDVSMPKGALSGEPPDRRPRIGFTFSSLADRQSETAYATSIAAQVPGSIVVVIGRINWDGKDAMIGVMYAADQPPLRVGVVFGNDLGAARDLVAFLMTDKPAPHVSRLAAPPWESPPGQHGADSLSTSTKWIVIGGGAAALAAGASLYAIDRNPGRGTAPYGAGLGAVGAAAVCLGLWLGRAPRGPVVSVSSSHAMLGWADSF